ncbi:gluconate 2-dehydrogenase subunit 3 family protein [Salegentibacter maritimus]|uniref:Gluconate 2-dehydrogenase subunit 3 family protein n=1 Tax=Salegentibacter maritimus TaxID=2794347 RepID=A0ABS0THV8_9FLAO|nr:gluconate 2-dehydrogenase subunit 3 family protein [Salegentibacter maritimus]MBI6120628.1 gluconate 2-dehydrogenase subunit 3 family protein [Salegentibacter maritimus]
MDRRESLRTLVMGGMASGLFLTSCVSDKKSPVEEGDILEERENYGRTPEEIERDEELMSETFFTKEEMAMIANLADIIIPEDEESVSATEAGVPEFIEFIVKDIPEHQLPMRGGLMWLNRESSKQFDRSFVEVSKENQLKIIDQIAYPQDFEKTSPGPTFFRRIKNLVVTGYFTSEPGFKYLDYRGNTPNVWDGVPEHVLKKHGMQYDLDLLKHAMDPSTRNEVMNWDDYQV